MLRKLVLHGFKSFCLRTEIALGKGITAVVGPNGCGKSNLADALRWVLGEQNPRQLRSSKQEDVIFSGTAKRKAMGMAEVRLLFDGIEEDKETEIVRRYARDGSSEYRINGKVCRWKDIVETLSGTGLSHSGYVVIGQGVIQDLVTAKPEERRSWIEEASGVSRARLGEKEMERRIEAARLDLQRLEDLLTEISGQKARLASDRESAREYRKLVEERKSIELSLWLSRYDEEKRKLALAQKRLAKHTDDLLMTEEKLPVKRAELVRLRAEESLLQDQEERLSSDVEHGVGSLLDLEKRRDTLRGQLSYINREIDTRTARKAAVEKEIGENRKEVARLNIEKQRSEEALSQVASKLALMDERRARSQSVFREVSQKVLDLRQKTLSLTEELGSVRREKDAVWRRLDGTKTELAGLEKWLTQKREEAKKESHELDVLEMDLDSKRSVLNERASQLAQLETLERAQRAEADRLVANEKSVGARLSAIRARKKLLTDMERSFEGYASGPKAVLEAHSKGSLEGILGSVGELISCSPNYIPALSAALGGAVENIVVKDEESAKRAISFLRGRNSGRATFLPLSVMNPRKMSPRAAGLLSQMEGVRPLLSVIDYPPEVYGAVSYLLERVVLADNLDVALKFMRGSGWSTRVVTLLGEVVEPGGAMTGGQAPRHEAFFRRKHEIMEISVEEARLSKELNDTLAKRVNCFKSLDSIVAQASDLRKAIQDARAELARVTEVLTVKKRHKQVAEQEIKSRAKEEAPLRASLAQLEVALAERSRQEEDIAGKISDCEKELKDLEVSLRESLDSDRESLEAARSLAVQKESLEREVATAVRRLEGLSGEISSLEKSRADEDRELQERRLALESIEQEEKAVSEKISTLEREVSQIKGRLSAVVKERQGVKKALEDCATEIERLERDRGALKARMEDVERDISELERAVFETMTAIRRDFGVSNPDEQGYMRASRQEVSQRLEEIDAAIGALGSVNLKAEEEYSYVEQRLEMLSLEKQDVIEAIEELERAKTLIAEEMRQRFHRTFAQVNEKFQEVFRELFGGGRGELQLIPDTLGIDIHAEPPGRRQKQVNLLSGGERSLCGIALIFAILSVRPSPLIVLDEADTALDDSNVVRFGQYLRRYSQNTQFLVITHQKATMEAADILYGVTMQEPGVSTVYSMRLEDHDNSHIFEGEGVRR